nr:hypothetical protein CFP56_52831 [Quercus suber]
MDQMILGGDAEVRSCSQIDMERVVGVVVMTEVGGVVEDGVRELLTYQIARKIFDSCSRDRDARSTTNSSACYSSGVSCAVKVRHKTHEDRPF